MPKNLLATALCGICIGCAASVAHNAGADCQFGCQEITWTLSSGGNCVGFSEPNADQDIYAVTAENKQRKNTSDTITSYYGDMCTGCSDLCPQSPFTHGHQAASPQDTSNCSTTPTIRGECRPWTPGTP